MTAYELISWYYGDRIAERSQVSLINHIDESLQILAYLNANRFTQDAFCIHPMIQSDINFQTNLPHLHVHKISAITVALAVEYRHVANTWLSDKVTMGPYFPAWKDEPSKSIVPEVNLMLIADKVQNYKDFCIHHKATHERSAELETYFQRWFKALDVSPFLLTELTNLILARGSGGADPKQTVITTETGTTVTW